MPVCRLRLESAVLEAQVAKGAKGAAEVAALEGIRSLWPTAGRSRPKRA